MKKRIFNFGQFLNESSPFEPNSDLVGLIDYTLLRPEATEEDIIQLCEKADKLGVKSVCVLPKMVRVAAETLEDSNVLVCTVVSFPHGTDTTEQKLAETKRVISDGADEVDMVLNYPLLKKYSEISNPEEVFIKSDELIYDVATLVEECHSNTNKDNEPVILKVIVESGALNEIETENATNICLDAGANFIKTSTGMVAVGAELDKVRIMKRVIDENDSRMKIKASGGIRTMSDLQKFKPYVDRFGVGFASVDSIFGGELDVDNSY